MSNDTNGEDTNVMEGRGHPSGERPSASTPADREQLPDWWRRLIEEFEAHDLTYHPPRFEDGEFKQEIVNYLERELDISILLVGFDVSYQDDWSVVVNGTVIGDIGRHRSSEGYTVFEMDSDAFVDWVESAVSKGTDH